MPEQLFATSIFIFYINLKTKRCLWFVYIYIFLIIAAFIPGVRLKRPCWSWVGLDIKNLLGSDWELFLQEIQILEFHLKIKMSYLLKR